MSILRPADFNLALGILSGRIQIVDAIRYWKELGYRDQTQCANASDEDIKGKAEGIISSQFEEICERIYDLENKTSEDMDY